MFSHDDNFVSAKLLAEARSLETNYTIQPNDQLNVNVYTMDGEKIIDPDLELNKGNTTNGNSKPNPEYLVRVDGTITLPMVGNVMLEGLTIHEANEKLIELYNEHFVDTYVIVSFTNKRVTVLGAPGGQIIPLKNENLTVTEVLALAGGMDKTGNASRIKLIRGSEVFLIDFSTVQGYYETNQIVLPGDVIYIEPIKRLIAENANVFALILSVVTTTTTLLVLFIK